MVSHEYPYAAINCTVMILLMGKTLIMPKHRADNSIDFDELMARNRTYTEAEKKASENHKCRIGRTDK